MDKIFDTSDLQVKIDGDFTIIRQNANAAFANAEWFRNKIHNTDMIAIAKTFLDLQGYAVVKREPELKACPNPECGSSELSIDKDEYDDEDNYWVRCDTCGLCGPIAFTESVAVKLYNNLPRKDE